MLTSPLPAGPVSCAPCHLVLGAEGVTAAIVKGPALGTHLCTHHLGFRRKRGLKLTFVDEYD